LLEHLFGFEGRGPSLRRETSFARGRAAPGSVRRVAVFLTAGGE
jgi:hypothetical protein